jgi:putative hydrolase of the HAD superfamily
MDQTSRESIKPTRFVFDADGVLCTGGPFTGALEREYGISSTQLSGFFQNIFPACVTGEKDLREQLSPFLHEIGWKGSDNSFLHFWFEREHVINQVMLRCINDLKSRQIHCYLATNQEKYRLAYMRNEMGFANIFDHIFASCEMGCKKPNSQFFERITEELCCNPDEILLVDDSLENVSAAINCKWQAVHYRTFSDLELYL